MYRNPGFCTGDVPSSSSLSPSSLELSDTKFMSLKYEPSLQITLNRDAGFRTGDVPGHQDPKLKPENRKPNFSLSCSEALNPEPGCRILHGRCSWGSRPSRAWVSSSASSFRHPPPSLCLHQPGTLSHTLSLSPIHTHPLALTLALYFSLSHKNSLLPSLSLTHSFFPFSLSPSRSLSLALSHTHTHTHAHTHTHTHTHRTETRERIPESRIPKSENRNLRTETREPNPESRKLNP
jgi:hypothetical protein